MRRYAMVVVALLVLFLVIFAIVEAAGFPLLTDPTQIMNDAGPFVAAAIGVGLLVADVVVPVPSSVVMVLHGALFGAVLGATFSLVGGLGAALVGFGIGRRTGPQLDRFVSPPERRRGDELLSRWGLVAIVATRPVPVLAETTAILAGTARSISWLRFTLASVVGTAPAAVLYAIAGAIAVDFANLVLVFAVVLALAVIVWCVEQHFAARKLYTGAAEAPGTAAGAQ